MSKKIGTLIKLRNVIDRKIADNWCSFLSNSLQNVTVNHVQKHVLQYGWDSNHIN